MRRPPIERLGRERKSGDARQTDRLFQYVRLLEVRVFEKCPRVSWFKKFKKFLTTHN